MTTVTDRLEVRDPGAYRKRLSDALGSRDPLDVLRATPRALRAMLGARPASVLRQRPFAGKWTPNEIVGHLVDGEWVHGFRTRTIVCDERPRIIGMDQDLWVQRQRHNEREPMELIEAFEVLRRLNVGFWESLDAAELERAGVHEERGEERVGGLIRMLAGHDLIHLDQLERYVAAIERSA